MQPDRRVVSKAEFFTTDQAGIDGIKDDLLAKEPNQLFLRKGEADGALMFMLLEAARTGPEVMGVVYDAYAEHHRELAAVSRDGFVAADIDAVEEWYERALGLAVGGQIVVSWFRAIWQKVSRREPAGRQPVRRLLCTPSEIVRLSRRGLDLSGWETRYYIDPQSAGSHRFLVGSASYAFFFRDAGGELVGFRGEDQAVAADLRARFQQEWDANEDK